MTDEPEKGQSQSIVAEQLARPISRRRLLKLFGVGAAAGAAAGVVPGYLLGQNARAGPAATELQLQDDLIVLKPRTSNPSTLQPASLWFVSPDWRTSLDGVAVTQLENQSRRAVANGYASLDAGALLPLAQLPTHDIVTKHSGFPGGSVNFLRADGTWASPAGSPHSILSATHSDTTPAAVVRGDVMAGVGASPTWQRLAIGSSGKVLHSDGTDVAWTQLAHTELGGVTTDQHHAEVHVLSGADHTGSITDAQHGVRTLANAHKFTDLDFTSSNLTSLATRAHADLQGVTSDQHHAQLHKAAHVSGGGDAFAKGDILVAAPRYVEAISDPASDSQRIWLNVARMRYWSNEGTPVKYDIATLSDIPAGLTFATPAILLASSAAPGMATTIIRSDSTIAAFDTTAPTNSAVGDAAAVGTVAFAARRDHVHGREAFVAPAIVLGSSAAAGSATTHIRSDATIAAFDATVPTTSAVGDAAAVGSIAFASRRDHVHGREAFATNAIVLGTAAAAGSATTLMRRDDTIAAFDGTVPTAIVAGAAAATGSIAFAARRDHTHGAPATYPATLAAPALTLGTSNVAGGATTTIASNSTILAFDATVPTTSAVGDAAAVGSATVAARRDHFHGREAFATNAIVLGSAAAAGSATSLMRRDDTIAAFDATAPTNSAMGDAAAVGTIAFAARRDHKHGREAFATPAIVLGSAAAAGSATTPIRSDSTIAAFDTTAPSNSAVGDVAAIGTIAFAARRDHLHGREAFATPVKDTPAALSAAGSATTVPRSDHTHQVPGGVARIVANVAIANTETAVITWTPGANFLIAGTTVRITGMGILTSGTTPGTCTLNIRCGTNATTGTVASTTTVDTGTSQTNIGFWFEAILTVRTTGASGTCYAQITFLSNVGSTTKVRNSGTTATAVIDTTSASTVISLSMISGNAGTTYTWNVATVEVVHMG